MKRVSDGETKTKKLHPEFKAESVLEDLSGESYQTEVCRRHNLSDEQLSKWKRQLLENAVSLFEPTAKHSDTAAERIVQLEQLVGRLTLVLDIQKSLNLLELTPMEQREMVEALRTDFSVRQICETLGFNRSNLYYHPKQMEFEQKNLS